ncbi:hypothetical protein ILUMI_02480 [Ignelater luminosus]|uniref:HAT C-terminal dimerisation domain-containing protein n=1 Tax=Ignelater luminosus TaxID=2038154 RepID=A0A8K0DNN7_IGNLU|nr:hypothetical protein ILUMI_02480 [Ignelater luminosus]
MAMHATRMTISTEEHHHRRQYVAEQIEAVFTDISINKVIAWCTDNAANMKSVGFALGKKWTTLLESDKCRINEVTEAFTEIEIVFKEELSLSDLSSSEQDKMLEAVQARRKMCKHLSTGEIAQGLQYIHSLAKHLSNVDENKVLENLANFRSNSGFWEMQFVQDSAINPNISPVTFWKGICTEFPLRFVAEEVLTIPATSAATERSFSSYGNIHTKKRNCCATANKIKIVTNNDKSLDFFGYKGNDKLLGDATDTTESTVTLGLEEKSMATNQSEPGFSG